MNVPPILPCLDSKNYVVSILLTSSLTSCLCSPKRNNLVVKNVRVILVVEAEGRDDLTQTDSVADSVLQRGIVFLDDADDLTAVHLSHRLTLIGLAKAGDKHLTQVLLLHELLVQFLNAGHLLIVEPIGRLQILQFVDQTTWAYN